MPAVAPSARRRPAKSARSAKSRAKRPAKNGASLWDLIGHLAGSVDGPGNLSALSKTLPGYGRSRSR